MNALIRRGSKQALVTLGFALMASNAGWSAEPAAAPSAQGAPSKETREKMASLHEQMAACLRSQKSFQECRSEMMTACRTTVRAQGCPMMGMGPAAGRPCMTQPPPATTDSSK